MEDRSIDIVDEGYKKETNLNIKEIILRHIRKISDISSQELTPSYWEKKYLKVGDGVIPNETYNPDLRMAYIHSVDFLFDLVKPLLDDTFKENFKTINEKEAEEFKKATAEKLNQDEWILKQLTSRRKLFVEIILLFERINFWKSGEYGE